MKVLVIGGTRFFGIRPLYRNHRKTKIGKDI